MSHLLSTMFLFVLFCFGVRQTHSLNIFVPAEQALIRKLLTDSITYFPETDAPISIHIGVSVKYVTVIDKEEQVEFVGSIFLCWVDTRLSWIPRDFEQIEYLNLQTADIWVPSLDLENLVSPDSLMTDIARNGMTYIKYSGRVYLTMPLTMRLRCPLNLINFPYDFQACPVRFYAWIYPKTKLIVQGAGAYMDTRFYQISSSWKLIGTNSSYFERKNAMNQLSSGLEFYMLLHRGQNFIIINIIAPCILLSVTAVISILVPPNSGEKVILCMTTHVSYFIFLLFLAELLPWGTSQFHTALNYVVVTMITSSCTVAVEIVIMNIYYMGEFGYNPPNCLMNLCESYLRYIVFVDSFEVRSGLREKPPDSPTNEEGIQEQGSLQKNYTPDEEQSLMRKAVIRERRMGQLMMYMTSPKLIKPRSSMDNAETTALLSQLVSFQERFHRHKQNNRKWVFIALVIERILFVVMAVVLFLESWIILGTTIPQSGSFFEVNYRSPPYARTGSL